MNNATFKNCKTKMRKAPTNPLLQTEINQLAKSQMLNTREQSYKKQTTLNFFSNISNLIRAH